MKFIARSLLILLALYGLVFALLDAYLARTGASVGLAIACAIAFIALQYVVSPWIVDWVLSIDWFAELPAANREFVERLCASRGLKTPRIGIIHSGTPYAFTFGHTPSDARVVVTTGLIEALTPEETNAVLAHELGHVEHWDFAVMAVAALAPLLLYQIYIFSRSSRRGQPVALGAYLCYILSQYVVLLLNRTREYFADNYAAQRTGSPEAVASALIKIAYGMAQEEGRYRETMEYGTKEDKESWRRNRRMAGAIAVMGISSVRPGGALALAGANPADAAAVMRWDLVNPWARVYELSSTHPLIALRVRALNEAAVAMHRAPQYPLPDHEPMRWADFPLQVTLWALPFVCGAALLAHLYLGERLGLPVDAGPALLAAIGGFWILRTMYRYHGDFQPASVGRLLEDLDVSQMRPRAVRLEGEIIGRGVPGAFWSPDLVLRDATGRIFILYRQSFPLARIFFAIGIAEEYIDKKVAIEGWFRRGLTPYVEMSTLTGEDGVTRRAWSRWVQYALSALAVAAGLVWWSFLGN